MKVNKKVIGSLEKCYAMTMLKYNGKDHFLVAAEKVNQCRLYDLDGNQEEVLWSEPGGIMTMQQVPGSNGQFLSTRKFYSPNDSKNASIVVVTPMGKDDWEVRVLVKLPFVHRFDILQSGGKNYLIACCLKTDHEYKDDWRSPGRVCVAELPDDLSTYTFDHQLEMKTIKEGMLKNHGYYRHVDGEGQTSSIVSCDNGVFHFTPPKSAGGEWTIEQLIDQPASDGLLLDINNDGIEELCTIAPFHGDTINIYEKKNGKFELAYQYPEKLEFMHAIFGGQICGKPTWILGHRKGERYLLAFTHDGKEYKSQILDKGCGAANVMHFVKDGKDYIVATNREVDEIAMYELTE